MKTVTVAAALALAMTPSIAGAQDLAGPFGGLFGRTPERVGKEYTTFELRTGLGGQFDRVTDHEAELPELRNGEYTSAGVTATLGFEKNSDRNRFVTTGTARYQQFYYEPRTDANSYEGTALYLGKVGTKLEVDAGASARRSPFYQFLPGLIGETTPVGVLLVGADRYAAAMIPNNTYEANAGFNHKYSKRATLSGGVAYRTTMFDAINNDFQVLGARGSWSYRLNRELSARVGYGWERTRQEAFAGTDFVHEELSIGLDYLKALTVARRTAMEIFSQTSMLRSPGGPRRYRLNGGAAIIRAFRKTWLASLRADRNTEFDPAFFEPLFTDSLQASVGGMLSRRTDWTTSIGAGRGEIGFDADQKFTTYNATSQIAAGVTEHFALFTRYTYYHYDLPPDSSLLIRQSRMSRQAVSVGIMTWVPIFTRMRVPRDPE